jgi:hypothetical protein
MGTSTRFNIVQQSLEDILERLNSLEPTARIRELHAKARQYERAVKVWPAKPPTEEQRAAMMKSVMELHVEVIQMGRSQQAGR